MLDEAIVHLETIVIELLFWCLRTLFLENVCAQVAPFSGMCEKPTGKAASATQLYTTTRRSKGDRFAAEMFNFIFYKFRCRC